MNIPQASSCRGPMSWLTAHPFRANIVLTVLYRLCLDILYCFSIEPIYGYDGLTVSWNPLTWFFSWLTLIIFCPVLVKKYRSTPLLPSTILITLLSFVFFIPLTSYYGCKGTVSTVFFIVGIAEWALLLFWQSTLPILSLSPVSSSYFSKTMSIITPISCLFVLFISGRYTNFRFTLNFVDVYGMRREFSTYQIPQFFQYVISMMPIVLSIELLYWLTKKKYIIAIAITIAYIFLFSLAGQKSVFFFILLTIICYYLYREWMIQWISGIMTVFSLFVFAFDKLTKWHRIIQLAFSRPMFDVVQLAEQYMEFFHDNPLSLSRDGIMGKFFFSPVYSIRIPRVIGEYRGNFLENANNGLLGNIFTDFPTILGLFLLPVILITCFRFFDMLASGHKGRVLFSFCLYFTSSFTNVTWSCTLLTNGFLIASILFYFFPREEKASP